MSKWVAPPNWPQPPADWRPPPGWQPEPEWGPAPAGWKFEQEDGNWFSRHKVLSGILGFVVLLVLISAFAGGSDDQDTVADPVTATAAPTQAPAPAAEPTEAPLAEEPPAEEPAPAAEPPVELEGLEDGSFSSTAPVLADSFGSFAGTSRVTNTSDSEKTATFTYTLFKGGAQVGTAQGVANTVGAGETATVQLISTDPFATGVDKIEFQVDAEF